MSGEYGKIYKRVWGDPDFRTLPMDAQFLYFKLVSQSDLSMAGVLTIATTRWAMQTDGLKTKDIEQTLTALEERGYVVTDHETQELLIRSYIRNDEGWRSSKTFKGITNAVRRVLSPTLRGVISAELLKIDVSTLSDTVPKTLPLSPRDYVTQQIGYLVDENPPVDTPSDTPSDRACKASPPSTATATAPTTAPTTTTTSKTSAYTDEFETWWKNYPIRASKKQAFDAWKKARKKASAEELTDGLKKYRTHLERNPDVSVKYAQGWLTDERWNDEYPAVGTSEANNAKALVKVWRERYGHPPVPQHLLQDDPAAANRWAQAFLWGIGQGHSDAEAASYANSQIGK